MRIPEFNADLALSETIRSRRPAPAAAQTLRSETMVRPQQTLFPPGTPIYTCTPPCTWGPPMIQTCCAEICFQLPFFGQSCFPTCFTKMAPRCPT